MATITLKAAGREIPLRFDTQAWLDVEEQFGSLNEMNRRRLEDEKPMAVNLALCAITAAGGSRKYGGEAVTADWLKANLSPKELLDAAHMAQNAVTLGMRRTHADDEDGEIDAVLAEIHKKKTKNAAGCSTDAE